MGKWRTTVIGVGLMISLLLSGAEAAQNAVGDTLDASGNVVVSLGTAIDGVLDDISVFGENGTANASITNPLAAGAVNSTTASVISTNASTVVKASAGVVNLVNINTVGTTSTVRLFNDFTSPCDTNEVLTIDTTALANRVTLAHSFSLGICALTAGGAAANLTVLYR